MSEPAPAQEQSAPTPAPDQRERVAGLPANVLADQIATAKMTGQGAESVAALEQQLTALLAPKAPETGKPVEAVVPKEQQSEPPKEEPAKVEEESQPVEGEPKTEEEPAAEEPVEPKDRIRMGKEYTDADKALVNAAHMLVKSGNAKTFTEAFARVSGIGAAPQEQQTEPEVPAIPVEITNLEDRAAALKVKLKEEGKGEGLLSETFADLTIELSEVNAELAQMKSDYRSQSATKGEVNNAIVAQQQEQILQATAREFPQMTDKTSEQWNLAKDLAKAASEPSHPDYDTCCSVEAPRFFAQKAAKLLGIKPATAAPSAPQTKPTASTPAATPAKPGPAPGSRTTAPTPTVTKEQILASADQLVADVLAGKGGPPKTAPPRYIMMGR